MGASCVAGPREDDTIFIFIPEDEHDENSLPLDCPLDAAALQQAEESAIKQSLPGLVVVGSGLIPPTPPVSRAHLSARDKSRHIQVRDEES